MAIVGLTFFLILGIILGSYYAFVVRAEGDERSRLLKRLGKSATRSQPLMAGELERPTNKLSNVQTLEAMLSRAKSVSGPLENLVTQSGLNITVGTLVMTSVLAACLGYIVVKWLTYYASLGLAAAMLFAAIPFVVVRSARSRRLHKFEEQFPEAIDLVSRALRAGHAFPTGLQMVADQMPNPTGAEFRIVYDRQNFGMPLNDALRDLAKRTPILDAKFFVTAVLTQRETGGNLAEVLDNLASVIRDRFKVKRHVRAVTAHGRITGWVLAALPPGVGLLLTMLSPSHFKPMFTDPLGIKMIIAGGTMQVIGTIMIRKLVNIRY